MSCVTECATIVAAKPPRHKNVIFILAFATYILYSRAYTIYILHIVEVRNVLMGGWRGRRRAVNSFFHFTYHVIFSPSRPLKNQYLDNKKAQQRRQPNIHAHGKRQHVLTSMFEKKNVLFSPNAFANNTAQRQKTTFLFVF